MDFGDKLIHFAGVGSGYNFYNFGNKNVVESYTEWAKARYSLYEKLVYGKDIDFSYDEEHYNKLKKYNTFLKIQRKNKENYKKFKQTITKIQFST